MTSINNKSCLYSYDMPAASHWSFRARKGLILKMTDLDGGGNLGALFYNPEDLTERYNAPDTLKCQHTFKLTKGHCLYSDMGRIFCSITEDGFGWHDTVCGVSNKKLINKTWGELNYQQAHNDRRQNGFDSFLVELTKYGLGQRDLAANMNFFSKVVTDSEGNMTLDDTTDMAGASVCLRLEMDTLVIFHTCPHPLNFSQEYPRKPIRVEMFDADPVADDDFCKNSCPENGRGFENNRLYYLGA